MGYTTYFYGSVTVEPPLTEKEVEFLNRFSYTRRMDREKGPYYVENTGDYGQDREDDIRDYNRPPEGQPSLWCQWVSNEDGTEIEWDGGEKFYEADNWMRYIIDHFIGSDPLALKADPKKFGFLVTHKVNGEIKAVGEDPGDHWWIRVKDNEVTVLEGEITYEDSGPTAEQLAAERKARDTALQLSEVQALLRHIREVFNAERNKKSGIIIHADTFEVTLRDLETAAGLR